MTEKLRVLLVEDNPADVRITQEAFRESGFKTQLTIAQDGIEALEKLAESAQDLILLDLNMPRMNGLEFLEEVKTTPDFRKVPVVMLTTSDAPDDIRAAYDRYVNCYVTKPVDLDEFLVAIKEIEDFWIETASLPTDS